MTSNNSNSVSVVIPCYNGLPYLSQALESARAQTHRPEQIIVVDDGSGDRSAEVVMEYAEQHPDAGVELLRQENAGEPAARNTGIKAARGEWVASLDTDDWWEPTKLEKQLNAAEAAGEQCVLVHTGVVHHFDDDRVEPKDMEGPARRVGWCTEALLEPASIGHPSILVRRQALCEVGGYDASYLQACDIDLYFRLSAVGTFAFVPEHLLHYRIHAGQMSASQAQQVRYHHRAVRRFMETNPEITDRIGRARFEEALSEHVRVKLESMYWRRRLKDFRALLAYADEEGLDNEQIRQWRRRSRWPDWVIRARDRFNPGEGGSVEQPAVAGGQGLQR